ncbi:hypothetical protein EJ04DRAFT_589756 [Polyplosphaeria fusca]|uniref:DUF6546 domain-containing protein n=1 Tax=Polyplosphaeria fusca TaxID=682080 RepID=A0A9P4R710_9PLEO|nr:hypothetical protein EJ04DRAFT_589756 [Polyplosphaeria fusca]
MDWTSLAAELRNMILEALIHEGNVAYYPSVCREWQSTIERFNFHSFNPTPQDIPVFENMTTRNFGLIKYIWYSIELRNYDCTECDRLETDDQRETNQATVEDGLRTIFCALSEHPPGGNMTLDISIHSPSDSQHHFKYIRFEPANTLSSRNPPKPTPYHVSTHSPSVPLPSVLAIHKIFWDIEVGADSEERDFWPSVPTVPCITHLLLRRQTRRRWGGDNLIPLIARLPNLQDLCYEPWRKWTPLMQHETDCKLMQWSESPIPRNMKKMTIFEDFNETYISANRTGSIEALEAEPVRTTPMSVTAALAEASLGLQHLSLAFIIDAVRFWEVRQPYWVWERLLTLSLTSRDLVPHRGSKDANSMIIQQHNQSRTCQNFKLWSSRMKDKDMSQDRSIGCLSLEILATGAWTVYRNSVRQS